MLNSNKSWGTPLEKTAPFISGNKKGNSAYPPNWMELHSRRPFSWFFPHWELNNSQYDLGFKTVHRHSFLRLSMYGNIQHSHTCHIPSWKIIPVVHFEFVWPLFQEEVQMQFSINVMFITHKRVCFYNLLYSTMLVQELDLYRRGILHLSW